MLDALFRPRSVAIVGASNNPLSIGHIVIQNLVDHGFRGPIFPINPKERQIKSFKAYKSILEVPDEVDLVNISIKNTLVPRIIDECGQKGVKFAIVHTAGFKEVGEEGAALEKEMVKIAHKHGLRVYGPNSQGVQNSDPEVSLYANFTFVPMTPGSVSILAQSGGVGEVLKIPLHKLGMGLRMYASFGNECDVSMNEILEYYGRDEGTKVIMVQVETFKDPQGFLEAARKITPDKPVLAIKAGRTEEGAVAVSSHTGSLLNQDTMTDAIFEKAGVLRFFDQDDMCKAAIAFAHQPAPKGNKIAIVTNTGGPGILALDEAILGGLELARLKEETKDHLRENLHPEATVKNPVDVVATATPEHYGLTVEALFKDPGVDMVLVGDSLGMVIQGHDNTLPVTLDDMIYHCRAVSRGIEHAHLCGDMPFMTYKVSPETALQAAGRMVQEGRAESVKLEGGVAVAEIIHRIVQAGVPVVGHVGLTPQSVHAMGGHRIQGKRGIDRARIIEDATAVAEAGAFCMVVEGVPLELAQSISYEVSIPTIGIGAGPYCDGQVLVIYDLIGMNEDFNPKFLKRYAEVGQTIRNAVSTYADEVRTGVFPDEAHSVSVESPSRPGQKLTYSTPSKRVTH